MSRGDYEAIRKTIPSFLQKAFVEELDYDGNGVIDKQDALKREEAKRKGSF